MLTRACQFRVLPALAIIFATAALAIATATPAGRTATAQAPAPTPVAVGGVIQAENACYVRLPDLPAGRYAGFGAYNPDTGVLAFAGGAGKISAENTEVFYELYAIRLDGTMSAWNRVPYSRQVGYYQEERRGCREMATVQLSGVAWASVFGKDGCDNGRFDVRNKRGGDIKVLRVGSTADAHGVTWQPNSGLDRLVGDLVAQLGKLSRPFAAYDTHRQRLIIGQGTFDDKRDAMSQDAVYAATASGSVFALRQLFPDGTAPSRRYGACAAYVYDPATGVDGVLVLGGQQGGTVGTKTYQEVWFLDFSANPNGEWHNITARFQNMDALGYRREGACVYDATTKRFYTWMGRANSRIPGGASYSRGVWRVDLTNLGDPSAALTWERLAPDNLAGIAGRHLIPSVWDPVHKRLFVLGGRQGLLEYQDVWAIYPDVTGAACQSLDPYAPFRDGAYPPPARPTAKPADEPAACPHIQHLVPAPVIASALANPAGIEGWAKPQNPGIPEGPYNPKRTWLSLRNAAIPWDSAFNPLVFKSGCP